MQIIPFGQELQLEAFAVFTIRDGGVHRLKGLVTCAVPMQGLGLGTLRR